jgi:glycosyltransferase involved in cell wall biosynthesis
VRPLIGKVGAVLARMPRVLLDATAIPADRGGVGRYVDNLAAALDVLGVPLAVVCQLADAPVFSGLAPHSRIVPVGPAMAARPARLAWEQTYLPRLAGRLGVDVIHAPHYTMPLATGKPTVVTLHDATFFSDRELHLGFKGMFFRSWTRLSLRRAARCIVPSRATADELVRYAGAASGRMTVAHHGVDFELFRRPTPEEVRSFAGLLGLGDQTWVAFLGTLEPRKNVPALITGFAAAVTGRPDAPALVLAGAPGWDTGVAPAITALPAGVTVIRTGHLAIELMPALLGGAELVAYPSLGEGFGLPVLEAMACGAAVLTTRRLALPEVGGEAVAYCGTEAADISVALRDLLADPARRADLGAAAKSRAGSFTWAACAGQHLQAYELAVGARS